MYLNIILFFVSLVCFTGSHAERLHLYERKQNQSHINEFYDSLVGRIRPGDILIFSDNKEFTVDDTSDDIMQSGNRSLIIRIKDNPNAVLRIAKKALFSETIGLFLSGHELLYNEGLPVPRILGYNNLNTQEYILVERIPGVIISWNYFVQKMREPFKSPHYGLSNQIINTTSFDGFVRKEELSQKFLELSKKLASFIRIGDLHPDNLVYSVSRGEWIVLDWTNYHLLFSGKHISDPEFSLNISMGVSTVLSPITRLLASYGYFFNGNFIPHNEYKSIGLLGNEALMLVEGERKKIISSTEHGSKACQRIF